MDEYAIFSEEREKVHHNSKLVSIFILAYSRWWSKRLRYCTIILAKVNIVLGSRLPHPD